jgi:hypothetical protein
MRQPTKPTTTDEINSDCNDDDNVVRPNRPNERRLIKPTMTATMAATTIDQIDNVDRPNRQ